MRARNSTGIWSRIVLGILSPCVGIFLGVLLEWVFPIGDTPVLPVIAWVVMSVVGLLLLISAGPGGVWHSLARGFGFAWCILNIGFVMVTFPSMTRAIADAKWTREVANARWIMTGLLTYAHDHGGRFPETDKANSNAAFRRLFEENAVDSERQFWSAISPFCRGVPNIDNITRDAAGEISPAECLRQGENQWGYVSGLDLSAPADTPILFLGFTGKDLTYDKRHPLYRKRRSIVGRIDGSVSVESLDRKRGFIRNAEGENLLDPSRLPEGVRVLNPLESSRARPPESSGRPGLRFLWRNREFHSS